MPTDTIANDEQTATQLTEGYGRITNELGKAIAEELKAAGADAVYTVSGATGAGVEQLLDAVLGYLPEVTPLETESSGGVIEDDGEEGESSWSPI